MKAQQKPKTRPHGGRNYRPKAKKQNQYTYEHLKHAQSFTLKEKEDYANVSCALLKRMCAIIRDRRVYTDIAPLPPFFQKKGS